jgi:nucleoside-diphosphate-sugar epimerase
VSSRVCYIVMACRVRVCVALVLRYRMSHAIGLLLTVAAPWPTPPKHCVKVSTSSAPPCAAPAEQLDVLVIGGTGFIGAPTARLLQQQGRRVAVLSRGCENTGKGTLGRRPELPKDVTLISCDRKQPEFAALLASPTCPRIIIDFQAYSVEHVEAVIRAHHIRPLKQYIYVSTNYVYPGGPESLGLQDLPQPTAESAAEPLTRVFALPNKTFSGYGGGKLQCEVRLREAAHHDRFPALVLRPPAAVGPGCDSRHERLHRLLAGLPPFQSGSADARRKPADGARPRRFRVVFSHDVAAAAGLAIAAMERGAVEPGEAFNVASGEPLTINEYAAAIARSLGVPPQEVSEMRVSRLRRPSCR